MEKNTSLLTVEIDNSKGTSKLGFSGVVPEIINNIALVVHRIYNVLLTDDKESAELFKCVFLELIKGENVFKETKKTDD